MDFLVKHFGMAVLYAACAVVVLALVFLPGQSGLLNRVGSTMSGWRATDTSGYVAYASESQQGHPVVEYSRADALALGTYSISDLIAAKDHNGNDARLAVLQMTLPSLNKQKCLVNPAFMRVCSIFKSLLITN